MIPTTTITGKLVRPSGGFAEDASIECRLTRAGSVSDGSVTERVAGVMRSRSDSGGDVNFALVPNDQMTPSDLFYTMTVRPPDGKGWQQSFTVPSNPDPIDIGDLPEV